MTICMNCRHFIAGSDETEEPAQGVCRLFPPLAFPVHVAHPITGQQTMAQINARPRVSENDTCGEFVYGAREYDQ